MKHYLDERSRDGGAAERRCPIWGPPFSRKCPPSRSSGAVNVRKAIPRLAPPDGLVQAAVRALQDGVHQYAPMAGRPDLRQWIAGHHAGARRHL